VKGQLVLSAAWCASFLRSEPSHWLVAVKVKRCA